MNFSTVPTKFDQHELRVPPFKQTRLMQQWLAELLVGSVNGESPVTKSWRYLMSKSLVMAGLIIVASLGCSGKNEPPVPVAKSGLPVVAGTNEIDKTAPLSQGALLGGRSTVENINEEASAHGTLENTVISLQKVDSPLAWKDIEFVESLVRLAKTPGGSGDVMIDARKALVRLIPSLPQIVVSVAVQFMSDVCRCDDAACAGEQAQALSTIMEKLTGLMAEIVTIFGKYDDQLLGEPLIVAAKPVLFLTTPCSLRFAGEPAMGIQIIEPEALLTLAQEYSLKICACETLECGGLLSKELEEKIAGKSRLERSLTETEVISLTGASLKMSLCLNKLSTAGK